MEWKVGTEAGQRSALLESARLGIDSGRSVAKALGVERGTALLSMTRLSYKNRNSQDYPVDYLRVLYHPERFEYRIDLDLDIDA